MVLDYVSHGLLFRPKETQEEKLQSNSFFEPTARKLLDDLYTVYQMSAEVRTKTTNGPGISLSELSSSKLRDFTLRPILQSFRMNLPSLAEMRLNEIEKGTERFSLSIPRRFLFSRIASVAHIQ